MGDEDGWIMDDYGGGWRKGMDGRCFDGDGWIIEWIDGMMGVCLTCMVGYWDEWMLWRADRMDGLVG